MKTVLVISNSEDLHASAVIEKLNRRQQQVFRLNTEDLLSTVSISLEQGTTTERLTLRQLDTQRTLEGDEIGAVWFRRPAPPKPSDTLVPEVREIVANEARWFLRWVYAWLQDAWWLSPPWVVDHAATKPLQLKVAKASGLAIPPTFYGNDGDGLMRFCGDHENLAIKPVRESGFEHAGYFYPFYTAVEPSEEVLARSKSFCLSTNFVQAAIPKDYELRVTWVDGRAIAVRICSQSGPSDALNDWRAVHWSELEHEVVDLPQTVSKSLDRYMQTMGLRFGAIDFIVTPAGEHVFLECNPNGQWLWLDEIANAGIADEIVATLIRACG